MDIYGGNRDTVWTEHFCEAINFERRTICQMSTRTKVVFHKKKKSDVCT